MLLPLTPPQKEVFQFLAAFFDEHGYGPSAREMAEEVGRNGVSSEIKAIRRKGWATKVPGIHHRSTIPTDEGLARINGTVEMKYK